MAAIRALSSWIWRLWLLLLLLLCADAAAQTLPDSGDSTKPLKPSQLLVFVGTSLDSPLFIPSVLNADTAIAVRYALMGAAAGYNSAAACAPKALNFFGRREVLPPEVCADLEQTSTVVLYAALRALALEFPEPIRLYAQLLKRNGLDPDDRSTDKTTAVGFGNVVGAEVAAWFAQDGWNSLGDLTRRDFRQGFEDFSGYRPVNSPQHIRFPLRWQPLTQPVGNGRFVSQVHVVPFLGGVRPLVLTPAEMRAKRSRRPYRGINSPWLGWQDARTLDRNIEAVFAASAALTPRQRFLARFWENKFLSVGAFAVVYPPQVFGVDDAFNAARWGLGEMLAQHDAMIAAWKEKRRWDVLRPPTAIKLRFRGRKVRAFVNKEVGVKKVLAEEWRPVITTQPHSEYPSASSSLCSASWEHARYLTEEGVRLRNLTGPPPLLLEFNTTTFPFDQEGITSIRFDSFEDAAVSCGVSRVWAGVHFPPAVPAGLALGKGIGRKAYEFVRDLADGKIPRRCIQCK